jgi:hypothetical protein
VIITAWDNPPQDAGLKPMSAEGALRIPGQIAVIHAFSAPLGKTFSWGAAQAENENAPLGARLRKDAPLRKKLALLR